MTGYATEFLPRGKNGFPGRRVRNLFELWVLLEYPYGVFHEFSSRFTPEHQHISIYAYNKLVLEFIQKKHEFEKYLGSLDLQGEYGETIFSLVSQAYYHMGDAPRLRHVGESCSSCARWKPSNKYKSGLCCDLDSGRSLISIDLAIKRSIESDTKNSVPTFPIGTDEKTFVCWWWLAKNQGNPLDPGTETS